jgi:hypothetical protein
VARACKTRKSAGSKPDRAGSSQRVNPTRFRARLISVFPGARSPDKEQVTLDAPQDSGRASNRPAKGRGRPTFQAGHTCADTG